MTLGVLERLSTSTFAPYHCVGTVAKNWRCIISMLMEGFLRLKARFK